MIILVIILAESLLRLFNPHESNTCLMAANIFSHTVSTASLSY